MKLKNTINDLKWKRRGAICARALRLHKTMVRSANQGPAFGAIALVIACPDASLRFVPALTLAADP
jgi:hypothetical protein